MKVSIIRHLVLKRLKTPCLCSKTSLSIFVHFICCLLINIKNSFSQKLKSLVYRDSKEYQYKLDARKISDSAE